MNKRLVLLLLVTGLMLAACGVNTAVPLSTSTDLNNNYENALSVQGQLALGTIQLAEDELAVDETQAATLLPLWRALQSLSTSDTTSSLELTAVVNQIQANMSAEQIRAIAAMTLTDEDIAAVMQDGLLSSMGDVSSNADSDSSVLMAGPGGGEPPAGGDMMGGGTPADMGGVAGAAAPGSEEIDGSSADAGRGNMQETMLTNAVIRFLGQKTGTVAEG